MQVVNINMTETSSKCPVGLRKVTSPKSLCRKTETSGCSSASFPLIVFHFLKCVGRLATSIIHLMPFVHIMPTKVVR